MDEKDLEDLLFIVAQTYPNGLDEKDLEDLLFALSKTNPNLFFAIAQSWLSSKSDTLERLRNKEELTLGQRIRWSRLARGRTQQSLAESVGVEPRTVQRWEAEKSRPRATHKHQLNIMKVIDLEDETIDYMTWEVEPGKSWPKQLKHFSGEELPLNREASSFLMEVYDQCLLEQKERQVEKHERKLIFIDCSEFSGEGV